MNFWQTCSAESLSGTHPPQCNDKADGISTHSRNDGIFLEVGRRRRLMLSVPRRAVCLIGGIVADRHIDEPVRKKMIEILVEIVA